MIHFSFSYFIFKNGPASVRRKKNWTCAGTSEKEELVRSDSHLHWNWYVWEKKLAGKFPDYLWFHQFFFFHRTCCTTQPFLFLVILRRWIMWFWKPIKILMVWWGRGSGIKYSKMMGGGDLRPEIREIFQNKIEIFQNKVVGFEEDFAMTSRNDLYSHGTVHEAESYNFVCTVQEQ